MGIRVFEIKRRDAVRAIEAMWLDHTVPPRQVLEALQSLRDELDLYIDQVSDELIEAGSQENPGAVQSRRVSG